MNRRTIFLCAVLSALVAPLARGVEAPPRDQLGREVKLRIVVDKVMQPEAAWKTEEWMIEESARAGFNVYSPRIGFDDLSAVRQVTAWCEQHGIYHMPWMRGSLTAPNGPEAEGKRLVWDNGLEQPLWSPNADEFWDWTEKYIVEYAKMSAENRHLMGVFLDYENYAPGRTGNLYSLSYDDVILRKFAGARGLDLPELDGAARKPWLDEQGLHEAFEAFQVAHWRERCRHLRQRVDEHDPTFQFCIYPAPGTPFMIQATYPEWATPRAPIILADASTYGRPARYLPERESLERNRQLLIERLQTAKDAAVPFIYAGGIDPVVRGADPEFCGKNAVAITSVTDGYWIFYEGPRYKVDHPAYWKWFTWANARIAEGGLDAWQQPRETPEGLALEVFGDGTAAAGLAVPEATGEHLDYPRITLRNDNLLAIACRKGVPVELVLQHHPIADYKTPLAWEFRSLAMDTLQSGNIDIGQSGTAQFTPENDALCLLGLSAGGCAYSITRANAPIGLLTGDGASFIREARPLYFFVPATVEAFTISARGGGGETVRINVLAPDGSVAATGQTTPENSRINVKASAGAHAGQVWSLEAVRADKGVIEDYSISLDDALPPVLAFHPGHVFRKK
ncbi:MAG: hypothetical protein GXX88_07040 [Candidatus Hydrogenedentes bacterium]|nr:hypothetical protein [Candidatus Hydrogenedentota bacterium]NLT60379.1 hypothetical protein [Candidatus Hydrogenedentota bacterium]HNZ18122.1 hypothetical protein [Candidatus Hydrogenedentota bacterium]HOH32412.1 hypothetical protein [Candidatus Hydrogenedentota bacterium]HPV35931.1 hypothetical protein [Candidatus Hydrogenedentota bacterium]